MNSFIEILAKELAEKVNEVVDLPFLNEEDEQMFYQFVISKVLELTLGRLLSILEAEPQG